MLYRRRGGTHGAEQLYECFSRAADRDGAGLRDGVPGPLDDLRGGSVGRGVLAADPLPGHGARQSSARLPRVGRALASLAGLVIAGCATSVAADPIPGSRPGLTDDPVIVAPGSLQAELGMDVGRRASEEFIGGEALVRYGLSRAVEARLGVESEGGRGGPPGHALGDPEVGFKIAIIHETVGFPAPAVSLLPTITLPIGADRLSAGSPEPGLLFVAGWDGPGPEWTANLGGTAARSDAGRFLEVFLGLALGHAVSERVDIELEVVRTLERGDHADEPGLRHAALGAAWLVHPDLQLDAWFGVQREGAARGRSFGVGLSVRR